MWWWDPFGAAVFAFSGAPAAGFDHAVFCGAGQGEVVDVGLAVVGPIVYGVVDLAVGPGHGTAGAGTAATAWHKGAGCAPFNSSLETAPPLDGCPVIVPAWSAWMSAGPAVVPSGVVTFRFTDVEGSTRGTSIGIR